MDCFQQIGLAHVAMAHRELVVGGALNHVGRAVAVHIDQANLGARHAVVEVDARVDDQITGHDAQGADTDGDIKPGAEPVGAVQRDLLANWNLPDEVEGAAGHGPVWHFRQQT